MTFTIVGLGMELEFQHKAPNSSSMHAVALRSIAGGLSRENNSPGTHSQNSFFAFNVIYLCYGHYDCDEKTLQEAKQCQIGSQT